MCGKNTASRSWRRQAVRAALYAALWLAICGSAALAQDRAPAATDSTIPVVKPSLLNPSFECEYGYQASTNSMGDTVFLPTDWQLARETGGPVIHSARIYFEQRAESGGGCDTRRAHVERAYGGGDDSLLVQAFDLETPPAPGKPFDVVLYQQTAAVPGGAYSLSGWLLSLCGGSATPSDCPEGYYITKAIGIDPTGGDNPASPNVVWAENSDNFVDLDGCGRWCNLRVAARAESTTITVFARLYSPFLHHGNHGFIDAMSLVRAPAAYFDGLPGVVRDTNILAVRWRGEQSQDIETIAGGTYQLLYDVQYRAQGADDWQNLSPSTPEKQCALFVAPQAGVYEFRLRARSEQPPAPPEGASPNHRYPGIWSDPVRVRFQTLSQPEGSAEPADVYLPAIYAGPDC